MASASAAAAHTAATISNVVTVEALVNGERHRPRALDRGDGRCAIPFGTAALLPHPDRRRGAGDEMLCIQLDLPGNIKYSLQFSGAPLFSFCCVCSRYYR